MRGAKKRSTSTAPSSQFAFSPPGWPLWELRISYFSQMLLQKVRSVCTRGADTFTALSCLITPSCHTEVMQSVVVHTCNGFCVCVAVR